MIIYHYCIFLKDGISGLVHTFIKRNKEDTTGLQPEEFSGYQILDVDELVFKLIDLQNIKL